MYYYVYDEFVQDPKFERDLALIETRLTDLGISGKIARLALFRDPRELIRDEIRKGVKTVVAVGNDVTLRRVIDAVGTTGAVIGIIPIGRENNLLSDILGVPIGVQACDVLSARIIEELDLGEVNGRRFLHTLKIPQVREVKVNIADKYSLHTYKKCSVEVRNLALGNEDVRSANPIDGKLECVIRTSGNGWLRKSKTNITVVPAHDLRIELADSTMCSVDADDFETKDLHCKVIPKALKVITGKSRKF